jgi:hypothetical protein
MANRDDLIAQLHTECVVKGKTLQFAQEWVVETFGDMATFLTWLRHYDYSGLAMEDIAHVRVRKEIS